ncbi:MAG: TolC family protein [Pseudomonadales bacterium]|nr:TolC family protein [Pseudomonadales bacterium]
MRISHRISGLISAFFLSSTVFAAEAGPVLNLPIEQAVMMALESNLSLKVQRLQPEIALSFEELEAARFDIILSADINAARESRLQLSQATSSQFELEADNYSSSISLEKEFSTGTTLTGKLLSNKNSSNRTPDQQQVRVGLTLTQALLQGFGPKVNLAAVQQAQLNTQISRYELQGFAESLVGDVEQRYWDLVLALRRQRIFKQALDVAKQQRDVVLKRIEVGLLAETERPSAEAEVARRRQGLLEARFEKERLRLQLIGFISTGTEQDWLTSVNPVTEIGVSDYRSESIEEHLALAKTHRAELKEARLRASRGDLELVQTRNALLPKLDFFITLGKSGYSDSFSNATSNIDEDSYDSALGLTFQMPLSRRAAKSAHSRARASREQTQVSLQNLLHLVQLDVRVAYSELQLAQQKIEAVSVTRKLYQEALRAENEKFKVGRSTTVDVSLVQRDFLQAQLDEMDARVQLKKAAIRLYQLEGSLLKRRGVTLF